MPTEFEAKFLDIDINKMRKMLEKIGAKRVHGNKKYFRSVYELCDRSSPGYFRVRDEGGKVTMTSKSYAKSRDFPEEHEVSINENFETALALIKSLGLEKKAYQETYREKWSHELAHEITFDTIPGIPTYMEVDCDSEDKLNKLIDMLGLDRSKMRYGAFDRTYNEYYGIEKKVINEQTPFLTFKNIRQEIKPIKNKELLDKIGEEQKEMGLKKRKSRKDVEYMLSRLR